MEKLKDPKDNTRSYSCWVSCSSKVKPMKIVRAWDYLTAALNFINMVLPDEITENGYGIEVQAGINLRGKSTMRQFIIRKDRKLFEWDENKRQWFDPSNGRYSDVWEKER